MSGKEGKGTKKDGESTVKVIPDESAVLQELEDQLMDRLLRKVREESGSEELGLPYDPLQPTCSPWYDLLGLLYDKHAPTQ